MLNWLFTDEFRKKRAEAKEARRKVIEEKAKGYWERDTETPKTEDRPKPFGGFRTSNTITINDDVVIVNGKRLTPGTPEYIKAKTTANKGLRAGMRGLDAGMRALDDAMDGLDDLFD